MITGMTIRNFKSIREIVKLPLDRFHVLVGPNASGKSTFLDALHFVRDCLETGPLKAVEKRGVSNFNDLTHKRKGGEIQVEICLDGAFCLESQKDNLLCYQIMIGEDESSGICLYDESLVQFAKKQNGEVKPKRLLGKNRNGMDFYQRENSKYKDTFFFGFDKAALSLTPPDEERYPTANAVKRFLMQGIRYIQLNSTAMRWPCPATRGTELEMDGTNLARVIGRLSGRRHGTEARAMNDAMAQWMAHVRYALPSLKEIGWDRREADNAEFLVLKYDNGLLCPSWLVSDGTLRMLALTLPAFLPPKPGIYMFEEPENGVHPKALEIIIRALATIPEAQVFVATHSPLVVQQVGIENLLCFSTGRSGNSRIMAGPQHPVLKKWDGVPDLATIFASGILG